MPATEKPSRSELVRQRRGGAPRQKDRRKNHAAQPRGKTAHGHPVLMRGIRAELPVRRRPKSTPRRRYDISLRTPGAAIQLPAMPVVQPTLRWLSALAAALLAVFAWQLWHSPAYRVSGATITGLARLPEHEINLVLGLGDAPVFTLNPADMERDLRAAFPELLEAAVEVQWPNLVNVTVVEREPVLLWQNPQGMVLVDATGVSFLARADASSLLVIQAPQVIFAPALDAEGALIANPYIGRQLLSAAQVQAILTVSRLAPQGAAMIFDPEHGMGWHDPRGWDVFFGVDGSEIEARMRVYTALIAQLERDGIAPELISVEHLHAPYYRMDQ
jgi:hypothetical protein